MRTPERSPEVVRPALEHLVRGIVDHPDDVRVRLVNSRKGQRLEVRVHPEDLGTVIGRGGRTARALRQVITSVGGRGVRVEIIDND
ncbi:MAG: RNA-binding protein [Micromonosporaceae bacterium]